MIDPRPKKTLDVDSTIFFGQYKGEEVARILETDPQYLRWVMENIEWLDISTELEQEIVDKSFDDTVGNFLRHTDWGIRGFSDDDPAYGGCDSNMWGDLGI